MSSQNKLVIGKGEVEITFLNPNAKSLGMIIYYHGDIHRPVTAEDQQLVMEKSMLACRYLQAEGFIPVGDLEGWKINIGGVPHV